MNKKQIITAADKVRRKIFVGEVRVLPKKTEAINWEVFFKREEDKVKVYKITPTPSVRNNQTAVLAKVIASFYRKPSELRSFFKGSALSVKTPYRCNFRIVMKPDEICFYLLLPAEKAPEYIRKAEAVYDSSITITEVKPSELPQLDPDRVFCTELGYRKHDIFSLDTDKANNYPLPSLLTAVRSLEGNDIAVFDAMLEPTDRVSWYKEAKEAHSLLGKGYIPDKGAGNKLLRGVHSAFNKARYELLEVTRFTDKQKKQMNEMKEKESGYLEAQLVRQDMTTATKRKQGDEVLKAWLRIAVQSEDQSRAKDAAYTIANSWKDLSENNELDRFDVPKKWNARYLNAIENRKGFTLRIKPMKVSTDEAGKFMQLPGDNLLKEFKQIDARTTKEVSLPDELTQEAPGVRLGYVTERGVQKLAKLPLIPYSTDKAKADLKAIYDAICTATFGQGKQGSGKSEGFGTVWAYDMIVNGFTSILIDTADGDMLKKFVNSLPADYPDEKIHVLNFDNKAYPIPLDWADIYGRNFTGEEADDELAALEISERLTSRFIDFINSLSATGEFTDKMAQYVTSCMRAITTKKGWSFLDLELALTSPAYRNELLQLESVQDNTDVVRDLEDLNEKAEAGKQGTVIDNIMNRIRVLSGTTFMSNLFLQPPKLNDDGSPALDLRRIMDNEEGGYGHTVIIQASGIWEHNQATILGFMEDKINFNAFGRIDVPQDQRKPVLKWIDEPHKVINRLEDRLAGTAVEFRKYRVKNLFTGHSIDQMGKAAKSLLEGGAQITSYKTESLQDLERFSHTFTPYDNAKELYAALPEKHTAINKVRLPSGNNCPAFIADMIAPPKEVKDRSYIWHESAKRYGRPWKEVKEQIQERRSVYREYDKEWLEAAEKAAKEKAIEEKIARKKAEKQAAEG